MQRAITMALAMAVLGLGVAWGWVLWGQDERIPVPSPAPVCRAEDSCEVDYRDGAWWLRTYDHGDGPGPWVRVSR